jgi:hypothetical protein
MWVSPEFAMGKGGILPRLLLQLLAPIPIALLQDRPKTGIRLPLCLRHHLAYGFPGIVLPTVTLVLAGMLISTLVVLISFEDFALGLLLAGATLLWLFVVLTVANYTRFWTLPIAIERLGSSYVIRIAPNSHFHSDPRI